jgi:methylated-DNA-protein-cysteine methyltransferase related protein
MGQDGFFMHVYQVVRQIPEGRVCTYGAIAKYLGAPQSARMVGWAMNASHQMPDVPAHRVVNRQGLLTGQHHFPGHGLMQKMLEAEGIRVCDNKVQNMAEILWDPQSA